MKEWTYTFCQQCSSYPDSPANPWGSGDEPVPISDEEIGVVVWGDTEEGPEPVTGTWRPGWGLQPSSGLACMLVAIPMC